MGIEITYTDGDGRRHNSIESLFKHETGKLIEDVGADVRRRLERVRCPIHGQAPVVKQHKTSEGFRYELDCCCDQLKQRAEAAAS